MNPITGIFQVIYSHLRRPCSKYTSILKFNVCYETHGILLFIFSCCGLYVWLIHVQTFKNTKKNRLISSVCFRLQSIEHKGIHEHCRVKVNIGKWKAWYMKIIWNFQYQFTNAKINWFTGKHNSSLFIHYCAFNLPLIHGVCV